MVGNYIAGWKYRLLFEDGKQQFTNRLRLFDQGFGVLVGTEVVDAKSKQNKTRCIN